MHNRQGRYNMKKISATLLAVVFTALIYQPAASQTLEEYSSLPPFITSTAPPIVMFVMSRDHKLFFKAYNDIMDLDEDGTIDSIYTDTIDYYGYFDPKKCYTYSSSNNRFEPSVTATGANSHYCTSAWSGNFMNWGTMARIDVIRKVLYGGKRSIQNSNLTVLSRALLPRDGHSWAKVYTGSDIDNLTPYNWSAITLCNLNTAKTENSSLIYVINGSFPYAASTEGKQCVKEEQGGSNLSISATYEAEILVCVTGLLEPNCLEYKSGASASKFRPTGLLQNFGVDRKGTPDPADDTIKMKFGLMSGSYAANVSGGVLRSNIGDMNSEIDNTNGQIKSSSKIIQNIDRFKVIQYNYSTGWYDEGGSEGSCVPAEPAVLTNGTCKSWGNPIGEMLYETIRYFQGQSGPTSEFRPSNPDTGLSSLTVEAQWEDPYDPSGGNCAPCSKPYALILSDTYPSFDSDQLPGSNWYSTINTADTPSVQTLLDNANINTLEGIGNVFIGQSGTTFDRNCTSKSSNFKTIRGLCAEEPTKQGSYYIAGLTNYAKKTDLNTNSYATGDQKMTTYAVATGSPIPNLEFTVGTNKVQLVPIFHDGCPASSYPGCSNQGDGGDNSKGALVDFQICQSDSDWTTEQGNGYQNCYDILWDDAEYGWDYELDVRYRIYVKTDASTITVKTKGRYAAAGHLDFAGYIINGVVGTGEYYEIKCGGSAGFSDCDRYDGNETPEIERTFVPNGSTSGFLKNPLWYAAKYGGFEDTDSSNTPNIQKEWDKNADGVPDTYFNASNPLKLEQKLGQALSDILSSASSGTSVSVLATSTGGEGAIYQAYFYPTVFEGANEISWLGYLQGLFFDEEGQLREDTNQDGRLVLGGSDASKRDKIVETFFDTSDLETKVRRYNVDSNGDKTGAAEIIPLTEMQPIWEAGKKLAERDLASNDRNIKTWVDTDTDGVVDSGEFIDFDDGVSANVTLLQPYLRAADNTEAENIIKFIRGEVVSGYRDRKVTVDSSVKTWRLGDIVYSSPVSVGNPQGRYDLRNGDTSYINFFKRYKDRRHVVYVGANDGMLHAFNAGYFHVGDDSGTTEIEHGWFTENPNDNTGGKALGEELWAFIPQELLPHLKWLTQTDYDKTKHVYYVDGSPKIVDAQVFTEEGVCASDLNDSGCIHPGGWGTVLIGSMRLGGGSITAAALNFKSAYFALDVTNPESDPALLWTYTEADLGFTMSWPAVMRFDKDSWYVVVGSGPITYNGERDNSLATNKFASNMSENGQIYVINLKTGAQIAKIQADASNPVDPNAFMGDPVVFDLPRDYVTDVVYIGKTYYKTNQWRGKVYRLLTSVTGFNKTNFTGYSLEELVDPDKPVLVKPTATIDSSNNLWVYFGTGRYFSVGVGSDQTDTSDQGLYGIKEWGSDGCWFAGDWKSSCPTNPVALNDLLDVTGISVATGGALSCSGTCPASTLSTLVSGVINATSNPKQGWFLKLTGGERVLHESTILGGIVTATTFTPGSNICLSQGTNALYAMYFESGTAYSKSVIGLDGTTVKRKEQLGRGTASKVNVVVSGDTITGFVQNSTGEIVQIEGIQLAYTVRSGTRVWIEVSD